MAKVNTKQSKSDEKLLDLVEVQQKTKSFFEHNQKLISMVGGGLLLLIGGILAFVLLYQKPRQQRALEQMMLAEQQFDKDSFRLALTNPGGGYSGFLDIIDTYSGTKTANLAKYYAGICYLHLGQYDAALEFLGDYSAKDIPTKITRLGTMGDAYAEKKDMASAMSYYKNAISAGNNELLTPYYIKKLGMLYMYQKDLPGGLAQFKKLKSEFPLSPESNDVDKYIAQAGGGIED